MSWYYWTSAGALVWTIVLGGCATTPPTQIHPITQSLTAADREAVRPAAPLAATSTVAIGVAPAAFVEAPTSTYSEAESLESPAEIAPEIAVTMLESIDSTSVAPESATVPINLPTALAMIGGQHPVVGFARWRVQEAYAQLDRAKVMWLPSIQSGFNYRRRDGNYQDVQGAIVDVDLNSFNYGLGAGAVAAGSPTQPGIVARFHLADALFLPKAAEKTAWARQHAATTALNDQLLAGALAYIDLLEATQEIEIVSEAIRQTTKLATLTKDYAEAGLGLQADADRSATELALVQTRELTAREQQQIVSTRLARILSIPMTSALIPQEPVIIPLELTEPDSDESALISAGLLTRPELREMQSLVAAACEAYKREKYAPFVPSVLLGFSTTSFGGGLGSNASNFGGRYDIDAMMVWETRNLGMGERASRRERSAQVQQAAFEKLRVLDRVAQEIAEANVQVRLRRQQIDLAEQAIERARDSYQRNLDRIQEGQGLPIEVLQAIQALETSQRAYLNAVANYNRAQLQLQWALGWPVTAPSTSSAVVANP